MTLLASFVCPILVIFGENVVFEKLYHLAEEKIQNGHFCGPDPTYCIKRPGPIPPDLLTRLVWNLAELKVILRAIISPNIFWNGRLGGQWTKTTSNSKYWYCWYKTESDGTLAHSERLIWLWMFSWIVYLANAGKIFTSGRFHGPVAAILLLWHLVSQGDRIVQIKQNLVKM